MKQTHHATFIWLLPLRARAVQIMCNFQRWLVNLVDFETHISADEVIFFLYFMDLATIHES